MKNKKSTNGTFLQGKVNAKFTTIVRLFGKADYPSGCGHKTDKEWIIQTPYGVATIYNWKNGKNYLGENGLKAREITTWNVGGHNIETFNFIKMYFDMN